MYLFGILSTSRGYWLLTLLSVALFSTICTCSRHSNIPSRAKLGFPYYSGYNAKSLLEVDSDENGEQIQQEELASAHHEDTSTEAHFDEIAQEMTAPSTTKVMASSEEPSSPVLYISNPLWPSGISEQDVDLLVDEITDDPSLNIQSIPDSLERQIYRSCVKLVLNAVYRGLGEVHGKPILGGHEFQLGRWKADNFTHDTSRIDRKYHSYVEGDIDEDMLEEVADRLLDNQAINQRYLPDIIERKVYINCLKVVFRLLGIIAASLRISLCGHEIRLEICKDSRRAIQQAAVQHATSSMTRVDTARMKEFARQAGIHDDEVDHRNMNWFERLIEPSRKRFMVKLHASLYGLILGILDDLLANTRIELLSDRVSFDIVPSDSKGIAKIRVDDSESNALSTMSQKNEVSSSDRRTLVSFIAGLGVGAGFGIGILTLIERKQNEDIVPFGRNRRR